MAKVRLGDVAKERKEKYDSSFGACPIVGLEHLTPEQLKLSSWSEDTEGNTFTKYFHEGDILFGRRRAYQKKAAVAPFAGVCSGDITVIQAIPGRILPELLPFIIQNDNLFDYAVGKSAGSLSPRVKWAQLKEYEFELPDVDQQKTLAETLWAMNETSEAYQELMVKTDEMVKSRFIELFGDPVSNPMGWEKHPLGKRCKIITGNTPSRKIPEYYGDSIEWIKSDNITNNVYLTTAAEYLSEAGETVGRTVNAGSILMTCIAGSIKSIGNVAITDRKIAFNQQINGIVPNNENVWFMYTQCMLAKSKIQSGINMALKGILSKGQLSQIEFIFPPIELQNSFADFAQQVDKSKFALQQSIDDLQKLKTALIQKYFH